MSSSIDHDSQQGYQTDSRSYQSQSYCNIPSDRSSSNQEARKSDLPTTISYRQLRSTSRSAGDSFQQSSKHSSKLPQMTDSAPYADVVDELRKRKERINLDLQELLDASLRAICAVSSFRKLLEERSWTVSAHEKELLEKASIKEFAELILLNEIGKDSYQWESLWPMEFLVKMFITLDSLKGAQYEARTVFSICANDFQKCTRCNLWIQSSLNLGALRVLNPTSFDTRIYREEKSYFNSKEQDIIKMEYEEGENKFNLGRETQNPRRTLQQLLLNSLCRDTNENMLCLTCYYTVDHRKISELHSLSAGLIVVLSEGSNLTEVPESLDLRECAAANDIYQFKAAILKNSNGSYRIQGGWTFADKPPELSDQLCYPLLLFYERNEAAQKPKGFIEIMQSQAVKAEIDASAMHSTQPQRSMESSTLRECSGRTAGLEAALRGLFTIRRFTDLFERDHSHQGRLPLFLRQLSATYKLYQQQDSLEKYLPLLTVSLEVEKKLPCFCIDEILNECDRSVVVNSRNVFPGVPSDAVAELTANRKSCEVLHDVFSVLTQTSTSSSYLGKVSWNYSRMLDIPLTLQQMAKHTRLSGQSSANTGTTSLEHCLQEYFKPKPGYSHIDGYQRQSTLSFLGSALIIRLFKESSNISQSIQVTVSKILEIKNFDMNLSKIYQLRAIVHCPESQENESFKVEEIEDFGENCQLSGQGVSGYLLFFDEETYQISTPSRSLQASAGVDWGETSSRRSDSMSQHAETTRFRHGLWNLGNTCFMNAALNGLYSLRWFRETPFNKKQHQLLSALAEFCNKYTKEEISDSVLYAFQIAISEFSDRRQHCANSYTFKLLMLLDTLLPLESKVTFSEDIFGNKLRQYRRGKCETLHDAISALVENLFICIECGQTRRNFSYFRTVDVPIPYHAETRNGTTIFSPDNFYPGNIATEYKGTEQSEETYVRMFFSVANAVKAPMYDKQESMQLFDCFKYMLRASLMSPQSKMQCDHCGVETQHYKQSFFRQLSKAFVVHFQRFDEYSGRRLDTRIDFPMRLDMSKYCVKDPRKYVLRGVVYHIGALYAGHYHSCINVDECWYSVDDSYVTKVKGELPIENAYMLFYEEEESPRS